jgi:acyl-CoA hydrolase
MMKLGVSAMTKQEYYQSKLITLSEALDKIQSGDCIASGHYGNETAPIFRNLHTIGDRVENVKVWLNNPQEDYPFLSMPELNGKIDVLAAFYAKPHRAIHKDRRVSYVPQNLHDLARCMLSTCRPNVFFATVTPMDKNGYVLFSCCLQYELELMRNADLVIFQVNRNLPRTQGATQVSIEEADFIIEETDEEIVYAPEYPADPVEAMIAKNVASLIHDGDTLQFGIGGLPGAVAKELLDRKDLGVHTEMLSTPMGMLMEAGVITNQRKNLNPGKSICTFMWGDRHFYEYVDNNPAISVLPASYVNDPFVIAQNDNMVSINSALEIDLTGQISSERMGFRQVSGTGGATDFAYGAFHSKGGRGIIAIRSTAKGGTVSKIQPGLTYGSVVSISRNLTDYVVTEYGIARLKDKSIRQRVEALISIAHPDFRKDLKKQAEELMIW